MNALFHQTLLRGALALALLCAQGLACAQVYRWVDERGAVHYGDAVPERYKPTARPMDLQRTVLSDEQKAQAEARLLADRKLLQASPPAVVASGPRIAGIGPATAPSNRADRTQTCEEQWRRYQAAWNCLAPYRNANGSVKPEGVALCPVVEEPMHCDSGVWHDPWPALTPWGVLNGAGPVYSPWRRPGHVPHPRRPVVMPGPQTKPGPHHHGGPGHR